jgi:hypothetical protein
MRTYKNENKQNKKMGKIKKWRSCEKRMKNAIKRPGE